MNEQDQDRAAATARSASPPTSLTASAAPAQPWLWPAAERRMRFRQIGHALTSNSRVRSQ